MNEVDRKFIKDVREAIPVTEAEANLLMQELLRFGWEIQISGEYLDKPTGLYVTKISHEMLTDMTEAMLKHYVKKWLESGTLIKIV